MKKRETSRRQNKSAEGELLYELQNEYELSPKLSEQIMLGAKQHLVREHMLREGQIDVTVVGIEERSGKGNGEDGKGPRVLDARPRG